MALVIETGSVVVGANSYVGVSEVRAYAEARTSSPFDFTDAQIEAAAINAVDYLESLGDKYQGSKVDPANQELQFPRSGVVVDGYAVPFDSIPKNLKNAQCQLAVDNLAGVDLMPTGDGREVIREKVDVLETEYSAGNGGAPQPQLVKANALIKPLFKSSARGGFSVGRG